MFTLNTLDHTLHGQTFTFDMSMALIDYDWITPLVKTYTVVIESACVQTNMKIKNENSDYRSFYVRNDLQFNFLYQVGQPASLLEIDLIDSVSQAANDTIVYWETRE